MSGETITGLLKAFQSGEKGALDRVLPMVYEELRKIARGQVGRSPKASVQATELVHEAFLRLRKAEGMAISDRAHFFALAAQSMRWVLRDLAKLGTRQKRGGTCIRVSFDENFHGGSTDIDAVQLSELFEALEKRDPRAARVSEMKVFIGLESAEIAEALKISEATVKRDWRMARAWMARELGLDAESSAKASGGER